MNRLFFVSFAVALCFIGGQALKCYDCTGLWSLCLTSQTTCTGTDQCFSGVGKAVGFVDVIMRGCLTVDKCNKTEQVTLPGSSSTNLYNMTKTCCTSDLCNSALGHPHVSTIMTTLAAIASLMSVKFLV
ncbi:prostate stem cell antigen [Misgurnus anguillicaudatus]|uniref:prostate stem cell antigen n=1 Tax=Misgurnus anguillicaudatus TaxID=75329 RepID=UPI003CCFAE79